MTKYFRGEETAHHDVGVARTYMAISDKLQKNTRADSPDEEYAHPYGEVGIRYFKEKHTPVFHNDPESIDNYGVGIRTFHSLARATGYSPEHIAKVHSELKRHPDIEDDSSDARQLYNALETATDSNFWEARESIFGARETNKTWKRETSPESSYFGEKGRRRLSEAHARSLKVAKAASFVRKSPIMNPHQLFTSTPASMQIHYANFDPSIRTALPTTVAMAVNDYGNPQIVADESLSEQSSKLAQHAAKKGLISAHERNPEMSVRNSMSFESRLAHAKPVQEAQEGVPTTIATNRWHYHDMEKASEADVSGAKRTLRTMLRGEKHPSSLSSQFDQPEAPEHPRLPGF